MRREPARSPRRLHVRGRNVTGKAPAREGQGQSAGRSNHMAPDEELPSEHSPRSPASASRRSFVKGLGAAGLALPALAMLPPRGFAEEAAAVYAHAAIDWKQFAGQTITLAGAIHPWSNAITPVLWDSPSSPVSASLPTSDWRPPTWARWQSSSIVAAGHP